MPRSIRLCATEMSDVALALINDVLGLAKIEADQVTLRLGDYNMPDLVRSVVRNRTTRRQEIEMRRSDRRRPADSAW